MPPDRQQNSRIQTAPALVKPARRRRPVDVRDNFTLAVVRKSRGGEFVSTYAEHQQSGQTEEWSGWQPPKLVSFVEQQTGGPWAAPAPSDTLVLANASAPVVSYGPITVVSSTMEGDSVTTHYQVEMIVTTTHSFSSGDDNEHPDFVLSAAPVNHPIVNVSTTDGTKDGESTGDGPAAAAEQAVGRSLIAFEQIFAQETHANGTDQLTVRITLDVDEFTQHDDEVIVLVDVFARCGQDPIGAMVGRLETGLWTGRPPIDVVCQSLPVDATVYALVRVEGKHPQEAAVARIPGGSLELVADSA
jgi:hypothetical protein